MGSVLVLLFSGSRYFVPWFDCRVQSLILLFLFAYRNSSWPATSHLCRQAARGWTHFGRLQHSKGLVSWDRTRVYIVVTIGIAKWRLINVTLQAAKQLNKILQSMAKLCWLPGSNMTVSGSTVYGTPLGIMQSQPCTWYCDCEEESLNPHWWLWQGSTTRRRWFAASKFSSFNLCCFVTLFWWDPCLQSQFWVEMYALYAHMSMCTSFWELDCHKCFTLEVMERQYDPRRVQGFRFSNLL